MSKYKTLDEWMEGKDRGDGRKFSRTDWVNSDWFFQPFFRCNQNVWHGVDEENKQQRYSLSLWYEWHPLKVKKKIKMYQAVFKGQGQHDSNKYWSDYMYYESKEYGPQNKFGKVVGWIEIEVLVDE
jgi:hypothetical protein